MQKWSDLEKRFRLLIPKLKYLRLDCQSTDEGEIWRLVGKPTSQPEKEIELLSVVAGRLLKDVGQNKSELKEIINHNDPKICWYRALKKFSGSYKPGPPAYWTDKESNNIHWVFIGSIDELAESSANVCLQMELYYPVRLKIYQKLWNDYGREIIITVVGTVIVAVILAILKLS